ncbi:heme exporter protein CcmB [Methanococcoides burtonii]|uniref:Heme exporter protein B n=1 Tax=Methanococcoides burtonii (strain DSM 6242 / NBRC 107633 / OCM 468 / ACE-M) TaxID=259564 RepID=Q12XA4_METBU|nr:heme exporter protein CcmB [Methanococcoides burtonii]ABE51922.1 ABC transporter, permease component [Methanococcoides burtonii DSM 6242]
MIRILYIAAKDLKEEFRTKQMLNSMVLFSLLVIVVFSITFAPILGSSQDVAMVAPGVLWIAFIFAGSIGLSRSFVAELENGCLEGLKLCPISRSAIYTGKMVANLLLMLLVEIITVPLFAIMFNYSITGYFWLAIIIFLGTVGFVCVGTLLSALTVNTRTREILLPVLLLPLLLPALIPAVMATGSILIGASYGDITQELRLLLVYDIVFFLVAQLVFEYVIQD